MSKQLELPVRTSSGRHIVSLFGVGGLGHLAIQFASTLVIQLVLMVSITVLER